MKGYFVELRISGINELLEVKNCWIGIFLTDDACGFKKKL